MRMIAALKASSYEIEAEVLWSFYRDLLDQSERGQYSEAAQILARMRREGSENPNLEAIRRLISFRISMKSGNSLHLSEIFLPAGCSLDWLVPETNFVNGLLSFHLGKFGDGAQRFCRAEQGFVGLGKFDRAALSAYNALIGKSYLSAHPTTLPDWMCADHSELDRVLKLAHKSPDPRAQRVVAMVLRQKATLFALSKQWGDALEACRASLRIFEDHGPESDRAITLLLLAFFHLELGEHDQARRLHLQVKPPFDERLAFPYALVAWLLGGPIPLLESFQIVTPEWKGWFAERAKRIKTRHKDRKLLRWENSRRTIRVEFQGKAEHITVKAKSKEGCLIQALAARKASPHLLSELLWPEQQDVLSLENRLYQLIHRVNQKFENLIVHDGTTYRLNSELYEFSL